MANLVDYLRGLRVEEAGAVRLAKKTLGEIRAEISRVEAALGGVGADVSGPAKVEAYIAGLEAELASGSRSAADRKALKAEIDAARKKTAPAPKPAAVAEDAPPAVPEPTPPASPVAE